MQTRLGHLIRRSNASALHTRDARRLCRRSYATRGVDRNTTSPQEGKADTSLDPASSSPHGKDTVQSTSTLPADQEEDSPRSKVKSLAERDEALKSALEDMSGEGGAAGLELEDGQPVAMKRGVRSNMFRYI
ncbi:hypothetical protein GLOTRDRAFT_112028 [Gloeophyllum trabeum ATCC 11539]|uniref:Uncharacterized protein n=1 Tax=Gloeophyllum trabeum (strain ATCC 11539 / FP-39264 / Madison 617) TaxID=670483 RepID=S7PYT2_GLOTA|nr:uncharacterized protein GLOTRDRAFT_112028 [Gloeophyllum trabeum ATCC 11539]EPQ52618.1 hypothetical protein GLOTRDRAFT_112028 [Gloeophyllum trabeum ATCC 11539]